MTRQQQQNKREDTITNLKIVTVFAAIAAVQFGVTIPPAWAQQVHAEMTHTAITAANTKPVTWENFVRAESDKYFKSYVGLAGIGNVYNIRQPTPIDQQKVVRMNRDTLYSIAVFDLTTPVTITKPDTGDRFQSMQVVRRKVAHLIVSAVEA